MTQMEILLNPSVAPQDEARLSKQCIRLLDRLRQGPMTNMQAVTELRILNLTARVSECRDAGYRIPAPKRVDGGLFLYSLETPK